jgi:small GTP-binding protein
MAVSAFKVLLVGEANVGKSSLIRRLLLDEFDKDYRATVGVDLSAAVIKINPTTPVILTLVDLGGQKDFTDLRTYYYRDAHFSVLVYDIANRETFDSLQDWNMGLRIALDKSENPPLPGILVGNKSDLDADRQVSLDEGNSYAQTLDWNFVETSAKSGDNVHTTFNDIAKELYESNS